MTPDRLAQINRVFNMILDHRPEDRPGAVDGIRQEDPELCREVEKLLEQTSGTWNFGLGAQAATDSLSGMSVAPPVEAPQLRRGDVLGERFTVARAGDYPSERVSDVRPVSRGRTSRPAAVSYHEAAAGGSESALGALRRDRSGIRVADDTADGGRSRRGAPGRRNSSRLQTGERNARISARNRAYG
jgi:hypothetical protein